VFRGALFAGRLYEGRLFGPSIEEEELPLGGGGPDRAEAGPGERRRYPFSRADLGQLGNHTPERGGSSPPPATGYFEEREVPRPGGPDDGAAGSGRDDVLAARARELQGRIALTRRDIQSALAKERARRRAEQDELEVLALMLALADDD